MAATAKSSAPARARQHPDHRADEHADEAIDQILPGQRRGKAESDRVQDVHRASLTARSSSSEAVSSLEHIRPQRAGRQHGAEPEHEQDLAADDRARGQGQRRGPRITLGERAG